MIASPQSSRPRLRSAERARLIDDAATRLFARQGYAATTVDEIAAAAGVTKPMLYRHYESKQELCIRLLQRYRDELISAPLTAYVGRTEPEDRPPGDERLDAQLVQMIDAWLEWVERHPDAARLLFTPLRGDLQVQAIQLELFERQRDTQRALLREFAPSLSAADVEPLAEISRAGFAAVALWWLAHPERPRADAHSALLTMTRGMLRAADHDQ